MPVARILKSAERSVILYLASPTHTYPISAVPRQFLLNCTDNVVPENVAPQNVVLEFVACHYKHSEWVSHSGPKKRIWMNKGMPKTRVVCGQCEAWLVAEQVSFEDFPMS